MAKASHIQAYWFLTYIKKHYHLSNQFIYNYMNDTQKVTWNPEYEDMFLAQHIRPRTAQLVQFLRTEGYTTAFISDYLGISRQSVSNANAKHIPEYINPFLHGLQRDLQLEHLSKGDFS